MSKIISLGRLYCAYSIMLFFIIGRLSVHLDAPLLADELGSTQTVMTKMHYRLANRNRMLVVAYPNRQYGGEFMFDTGTNQTVIVRSIARRLHLETTEHLDSHGTVVKSALDGKPEQYAVLPQLQVGEIIFTDLPCIVVDNKSLEPLTGPLVDGIIGANVLKEASVCVDFESREITIINHLTLTRNDLQNLQFSDAASMPLAFSEDGLPSVLLSLRLNGMNRSEDFVIDTGALTTNISAATAKSLSLTGDFQIRQPDVMSGERLLNYSSVDMVRCDNFTRKNVAVYFPDQDQVHGAHPHLGLEFLANYSILFDAGNRKLYLKPLRTDEP